MSEQGYNGWKNYPTWCVNLWLSNDEGLYRQTQDLVRNAATHPYSFRPQTDKDRKPEVVEAIKRFVEDLVPNLGASNLGASFPSDLLGYALGEVDWYEIAEAWLADLVKA